MRRRLTFTLPYLPPTRADAPGSLATLVIRELDGAGSKRLLAAASPADALAPYDLAVFVFDSGARAGPPPGAGQPAMRACRSGGAFAGLHMPGG